SLYSPLRSRKYHTNRPAVDHAGSRSADVLLFVRSRASPFSAGTVKISPRASMAARLPVGDSARLVARFVTSFHYGIIHGKAPAAVMVRVRSRSVFGSSRWTYPACSNTMASEVASSVLTSKSVKCVASWSFFAFVSYPQMFDTPSRSDRKYTMSPTQTGSISFESVHGGVWTLLVARS